MDDDGSKSLSKEEFSKGIRETGLNLNDEDTDKLFSAFDKDGEGTINYDEFLVAIRVSCSGMVLMADSIQLLYNGRGVYESAFTNKGI